MRTARLVTARLVTARLVTARVVTARVCAGLALLSSLTVANPSRAGGDEEEVAAVVAAIGLASVDISFTVRAAVLAANGGDSQLAYALPQTLISNPQAAIFNGALMALMSDHDAAESFALLHIPATMTTALAVHGTWSLSSPDEDQALIFLASTVTGVNTMWTSFLIGTATAGRNRFSSDDALAVGIYQMLTTMPGTAVGIHQALTTDRMTVGWIGISAWSGLLTVHGLLFGSGLINAEHDEDYARTGSIQNVGLAPTTFGTPVEGAPQTPGLALSGSF